MKREIIPACMPQTFADIGETASLVYREVDTIQLDLMDGKYVPEKTWPFFHKNDYDLRDVKNGEKGLPFWDEVNYELDLMVERPELRFEDWFQMGAARVIFHYASVHDWDPLREIDSRMRNFVEIGLAVTIHDDLEEIFKLIDENLFDFVQVMGIAHIGYMGEAFVEESIRIVEKIHRRYSELPLAVDGGVSRETILPLARAGAQRFVSGSGVFHSGIPSENIQYFYQLLEEDFDDRGDERR